MAGRLNVACRRRLPSMRGGHGPFFEGDGNGYGRQRQAGLYAACCRRLPLTRGRRGPFF
jgi:hypothetical protein